MSKKCLSYFLTLIGNREKYYALFEKLDERIDEIETKISDLQSRKDGRKKEGFSLTSIFSLYFIFVYLKIFSYFSILQ